MIRILLVDDHTLVRAGLERLLAQADGIDVVGVADSGEVALTMASECKPDVVLMDLSMPGMDGIEATRQMAQDEPDARVVMLTAHSDRDRVTRALDAGAVGYLVKDSDPATLIDGVRTAARGDSPMDSRAARVLLYQRAKATTEPQLSARESEVLALVAEGLANKNIARKLGISEKTVKAHLTRVFAQIGVGDRTQAALWARENMPDLVTSTDQLSN